MALRQQDASNLAYIHRYYGVDAGIGERVAFDYDGGKEGTIIGTEGHYLRVRFDDESAPVILHPTWMVRYLDA